MLICCLGPLLFFIVVPSLGLNKGNAGLIFISIMLLACFMMMGKGGGCCGSHHSKEEDCKDENKDNQQKDGHQGCH